jgi:predicted nucleic acid-binding protein
VDGGWAADRERVDGTVADPWAARSGGTDRDAVGPDDTGGAGGAGRAESTGGVDGGVASRGVLDTSVLIGSGLAAVPGELAVSVVSFTELQYGVLVATDEDGRAGRLARLSVLQRRFDPLAVDDAVADSYGRLAARIVSAGRRARAMDLLIAATAHAHGAVLYTRDASALAGLDDLVRIVEV